MHELVETAELLAFAKTVEAKSLSGAAAALRVPRATVSRRLARLEERLGARLLRRTTRSLVLTDAGQALYQHARIVLDAVAHAEASVRQTDSAIRGDLRVSVPPLTTPSFLRLLSEFARKHPEVRLQVHFSSEIVDLQRGDYDVALRASQSLQPGLVARLLLRDLAVLVASPEYLAQHGTPLSPRDLKGHRCLMGFARGAVPETEWPLSGGRKRSVEGCFFSNEPRLLCDAALRHQGIALLPGLWVRPFIESGALVHVLAGVVEATTRLALVYPEREFVPPAVRAFVDAVVAWAPGELDNALPDAEACRKAAADARAPAKRQRRSRPR